VSLYTRRAPASSRSRPTRRSSDLQSRDSGRRGEQDVSTTTVQGRLRHLSPDQCEDRQQEQQFRQSTADERLDEEAVEFRELHPVLLGERDSAEPPDRKSTRLNSSHVSI